MNLDHVINRNIIKDNNIIKKYDIIIFVRTNCNISQKLYQECLSQNILGSLKIVNVDVPSGKKILLDTTGNELMLFPIVHSMLSKKSVNGNKPLVDIINELTIPLYSNI